jgi:hypothetical protein
MLVFALLPFVIPSGVVLLPTIVGLLCRIALKRVWKKTLFIVNRPAMLVIGLHLQQEEKSKAFFCCRRHFRFYETENGGI